MTVVVYAALLVAGVTLLAITVVRVLVGGVAGSGGSRTSAHTPAGSSARRILDERYAAGDLSTADYQHRLRVLEQGDR